MSKTPIKRKKGESDSSSRATSSDDEHDSKNTSQSIYSLAEFYFSNLEDRWSKNKENLTKTNLDLASLKKKKSIKKKQRTNPAVVPRKSHIYLY